MANIVNVEVVAGGRAIFRTETAKNYKCPVCQRWIFSSYEGALMPTVSCEGNGQYRLVWYTT